MCEILLKATNATSPDPYKDVKCYKAGDVVVVMPDGWGWGSKELTDPMFRIVKLPNVTVEQAVGILCAWEIDVNPAQPSRMLQRRGYRVWYEQLSGQPRAYWLDATRASPSFTWNVTFAQLQNFRLQKAPVPDPNVIG